MRPAQPRISRLCGGRVLVERRVRRLLSVVAVFALTTTLDGCSGRAAPPPDHLQLALAPASFAQRITLQQHVHVERDGREVDFEAVLDIGPDSLTLIGMAFGQRILTLRYDGTRLVESRSPMLPREVLGADVLSDLQLALWPVASCLKVNRRVPRPLIWMKSVAEKIGRASTTLSRSSQS